MNENRQTTALFLSLFLAGYLFPAIVFAGSLKLDPPKINTDINPSEVIHWSAVDGQSFKSGSIKIVVRLSTEQEFTVYRKNLKFKSPLGYVLESMESPQTTAITDPISGEEVAVHVSGEFTLTFQNLDKQPLKSKSIDFSVRYIGCTGKICLFPYEQKITASVYPAEEVILETEPLKAEDEEDEGFEAKWADRLATGSVSFGLLLILVFIGGILTNLTPCVFPMIPITIRLLGNQSESPMKASTLYASGIVVTYTVLGLVASFGGGLFGSLMASSSVNIVFAIIMIVLGATMLGFGNFSKIQNLGNKLGTGKPSAWNTFLMGAGAGLVASPCTGPILAALLAYTAKDQNVAQSALLMFLYSLGFGLPYVFLGSAAAHAGKLNISPKFQIIIKLLFASVMFALGFFYLRVPLYSTMNQLKPMWPSLAVGGLSIGIICVAIWSSIEKLQNAKVSMILPTVILGIGLFSGSQYLTSTESSLNFLKDEAAAFAAAKESNKPILVDMWAEWCAACKKMDVTTFKDQKVVDELSSNWILLKMDLTEDSDKNDDIHDKYELQGLPTLVMVPSSGDLEKKVAQGGYVEAKKLVRLLKQFRTE